MSMERQIDSKQYQKELQDKYNPNQTEGRQMLIVGMLSDIADSLALLCDLYAIVNNITLKQTSLGDKNVSRT